MTYRLYYSPGACSLAVHVVLEEIGTPYTLQEVSVARAETQQSAYLALNPKGRVPALAIPSETKLLTELPAILVYLARQRPEANLLPIASAVEEARAHEWLEWLSGWVHGVGYGGIWRPERFCAQDTSAHEAIRANGRRVVQEAYATIERTLGDGREWALPSGYTIVDPFLLVLYRWGNRIGLGMRVNYAAWTALAERTLERPAVQRVLAREGISIE
ncbi:glutathione S-transferase N-terminal domain-containing protein [Trinickia soli]|uniref:Glutathione S-transferase n=1 Tax=Trinickia soli TaxID=380675 RepID=A0A2N7W5G1_9BURK|nr:glutathione S-transferase N-terminal domain-containing protein [Trinickia soli]PMS24632.1 glutathione S-transferase [Trinickia soli]CAB3651479.1 Glutathione S-transferase GST-6.0 [Trinickia soli]